MLHLHHVCRLARQRRALCRLLHLELATLTADLIRAVRAIKLPGAHSGKAERLPPIAAAPEDTLVVGHEEAAEENRHGRDGAKRDAEDCWARIGWGWCGRR